jgi:hypothetical protein
MKKLNNESVRAGASAHAKIGILTTNKLRSLLHISAASTTQHQRPAQATLLTIGEKQELEYEIDAELKRAQARTYANALVFR